MQWSRRFEDTSAPDPARAIGGCRDCESQRCPHNDMTGGFSGHPNCPLYGYCVAVKTGVSGWYCNRYVTGGETSFTRFFAG